ncbi:MAG: FAD-binding oxidoreductase [Desulfosarcina sp.]
MPRFRASLVDRQWLAPGMLELRLARPADLAFIPGQFLRFEMAGYWRDYSMVSVPESDTVDFCVAMVEGGRFSTDVTHAEIGSVFSLSGPYGYFVFQEPPNPAVLVATGTGVAPFVAFCRGGVTGVLLLHGVRTSDQLIYRDLFQATCRPYVPCISRSQNVSAPDEIFPGRVTGYLERQLKPGTYDFYLCGRRSMIRDAAAIIDERFGDSRLFVEAYD